MIDEAAIAELKAGNPVDAVAGRLVALRRHGKGFIGPCPVCSADPQKRDSTRFECDAESWKCAVCCDGGDVIALVQRTQQLDFLRAVEWLGGVREVDEAAAAQRAREAAERRTARDREAAHYRERERRTLWGIWQATVAAAGSPVENYLARRALTLPDRVRLRCAPELPYFAHGGRDAAVIHRGPAMLAPITGPDGRFAALHMTWLDPSRPNGKVALVDAEGAPLPAKKVRGSKACGVIELVVRHPVRRWVVGEGIETVLSAWLALAARDRDGGTAFVAAVDLGNLGGPAAASVRHPQAVSPAGRALRIPGPEPDLDKPAIAVPDEVEDVVLLGDGDSDRLLTGCALVRAAKRLEKEGRSVRVAWAPPGLDFNDLLRIGAP